MVRDFKTLLVWQKAHHLTLEVYKATLQFPKEEVYGLTSQLRRACVSIHANIAEGCGRGTDGELQRFLQIAMGSAGEVEYYLLLSHDLALLSEPLTKQLESHLLEVKRMLNAFIMKLKTNR